MAFPIFEKFLHPTLMVLSDGVERHISDLTVAVADRMSLPEQERTELVASGRGTKLRSRVGWARTYLSKAGLIVSPRRGIWRISDAGSAYAKGNTGFGIDDLRRFPSFVEFEETTHTNDEGQAPLDVALDSSRTPKESLEQAYVVLRRSLESDVLERVRQCTPLFFEHLVVDLLARMGYGSGRAGAARVTAQSGDEGIDGIISEDHLGLDSVYIQAKKWENVVGRPEIHRFVGALIGQGAKKGVFITTSRFSSDAIQYAERSDTRIVLIDGKKLAEYMVEFNVGVTQVEVYPVKRLDGDYFEEE